MSNEKINTGILSKLTAIMTEVDYIQKDARNEHGKYRYASEKAIKEAIHPALAKHRVVFQMNAQAPTCPDGKTQYVPVEYIFWDADTGESISGNFVGSAHTRDEKGYYAAITGAIKYILTSTFLIPTGDDPEDPKNDAKPKQQSARPAGTTANAGGAKPQTPANGKVDFFDELQWFQMAEDLLIGQCGVTHEKVVDICKATTGKTPDQMDKATKLQRSNYKDALKKALAANQMELADQPGGEK